MTRAELTASLVAKGKKAEELTDLSVKELQSMFDSLPKQSTKGLDFSDFEIPEGYEASKKSGTPAELVGKTAKLTLTGWSRVTSKSDKVYIALHGTCKVDTNEYPLTEAQDLAQIGSLTSDLSESILVYVSVDYIKQLQGKSTCKIVFGQAGIQSITF